MATSTDIRPKRATPARRTASSQASTDAALIDALPVACALFRDRDGVLVAANAAFKAAFAPTDGFTRDDFDAQFTSAVATSATTREALHMPSGR